MSREDDSGFLSRWSKRKLENTENTELPSPEEEVSEAVTSESDRADPAPIEAVDEQSTPIWQRDDVDAETKKNALRALFRKPEFNVRDGLNEYDDDFTQFAGLGSVVTHEMKRMLKLAEQATRPEASSAPENIVSDTDTETDAEKDSDKDSDKEDKDLA